MMQKYLTSKYIADWEIKTIKRLETSHLLFQQFYKTALD